MLVEVFALVGVRLHELQQHPILLQHCPVPRFQAVLVEEAPGVALPAGQRPATPVEHRGQRTAARRIAADNGEVAARAAGFRVGDFQAQPVAAVVHELGPVEVHPALAFLLEEEPVVGVAGDELGGGFAFAHRVRHLVQVGAVHRVHDVVDHVAIVTFPLGVADEAAPLGRGQLLGQHQLRRRLQMRVGGVEQKDRTRRFAGMEHAGRAATFKFAAGAAGHLGHGAVAAHFDAVIRALQAITQDRALGQRRTAMGAMVFQGMYAAIVIAPQGNLVAEAAHRYRLFAQQVRGQYREPEVFEAIGQMVFNRVDGQLHSHFLFLLPGHSPSRAIRV